MNWISLQYPTKFSSKIISFIIICYLLVRIVTFPLQRVLDLGDFFVSEFFVNFEGGFVRRGLVGQLLFYWYEYTGIDPRWLIIPVCSLCFIYVVYSSFEYLKKNQVWWWILALPFCFGNFYNFIIRKDMINLCLMILCFFIYNKKEYADNSKLFLITIISILMLFINEASFFFFMPFMIIAFLRDKRLKLNLYVRLVYPCLIIATLFLIAAFTGNSETPYLIDLSWKKIMPDYVPGGMGETIKAVGWSTEYALEMDKSVILGFLPGHQHIDSHIIIAKLSLWLIIPYFVLLYPYIMKKNRNSQFSYNLPSFFLVILIQFISILPLLAALSCDYDRCFMYLIISSLFITKYFSQREFIAMFPNSFISVVGNVKSFLKFRYNFLLLLCIMLFIGVNHDVFPRAVFANSVIGKIFIFLRLLILSPNECLSLL